MTNLPIQRHGVGRSCRNNLLLSHSHAPPSPPLTQVPVVVVTSFRDAVKDVLDAALQSIRGHKWG